MKLRETQGAPRRRTTLGWIHLRWFFVGFSIPCLMVVYEWAVDIRERRYVW